MQDHNDLKTIAIVGATSLIAQHCARQWLQAGGVGRIALVGRDVVKLQSVANDLQVRSPQTRIEVLAGDMTEPASITSLVSQLISQGAPDSVLIAHGNLPDQAQCQTDAVIAAEALTVNGLSPVLWAEAFAIAMESRGQGTIGVIGSVAGDRGRRSNYVYGAAKGLVERYIEGLQHRLAGSEIRITLVKPGPTDTPMTAHLKRQGTPLADVQEVATAIIKGMNNGVPIVYTPRKWQIIMLIIKFLPRFVFNKLNI